MKAMFEDKFKELKQKNKVLFKQAVEEHLSQNKEETSEALASSHLSLNQQIENSARRGGGSSARK